MLTKQITRIVCCLLFALMKFECHGAPDQRMPMLVPFQQQLDYSRANWQAVESVRNRIGERFPFLPIKLPYEDPEDLVSQVKEKLSNYVDQAVLVLGPADSGEAAYLDQVMTNISSNVLFVSPSVTTKANYTNLKHFVRACLPDSDRIENLARVAPPTWRSLDATFIGMTNTWGQQLFQNLNTSTNLVRNLGHYEVHNNGREAVKEYAKIARACRDGKVQLLFLGLSAATEVRAFFEQCQNQSTFWSPYKPMICLLGDYRFTNAIDSPNLPPELIAQGWGNAFPITMLSEASLGFEGSNLYEELATDLVTVLADLKEGRTPNKFFADVESAFSQEPETHRLLAGISIRSSHYMRHLQDPPRPCSILKWLGYDDLPLFKSRQWFQVTKEGPILFWYDLFRTRVFWIGNSWLILIALAALTGGLLLEIRKRYVFVRPKPLSLFSRLLAWSLIISSLFVVLLYLSWVETLNPANFTAILVTCLTPMAVLPMLQHAAFTKVPWVRPVLELPSTVVEAVLDQCINSRVSQLRLRHKEAIIRDLQAQSDGRLENQEAALWHWWCNELREVQGEAKARKVYERCFTTIKVWDADFNDTRRIEALIDALAYTRIVNRRATPAPEEQREPVA